MSADTEAAPAASLSHRSLKAIKWNYLGAATRVILQFLIGIVLARWLGPEPFGLVAVASLVLGLGALFADFGLASALIQLKEVSQRDIRYVFTLQSTVGLLLTCVLELGAVQIAAFFKRPDALPVLRALFLTFFIQGLGQTATALLKRQLDFRRNQLAQIGSYVLGYLLIGLPMAWYDFGVWSLVAAQLSQTLSSTVVSYAMIRHPVMPCWRNGGHALFHFGLVVTATNLSNWGLACLDSLVVGRAFGVTQLGLYNRAIGLVAMPTFNVVSSLQSVLFSASARVQDDRALLLNTYLGVLGMISFLCMPVFCVVAVVPHTMIAGVYGSKWLAATDMLTPLALAMPFSALMGMGGPLMMGMGQVRIEMRLQFYSLLVYLALLWWASTQSVLMIAWSLCAIYILRFLSITSAALALLDGRWRKLSLTLRGPAALGIMSAVLAVGVDRLFQGWPVGDALRLLMVGACCAVGTPALFIVCRRWMVTPPVAHLLRKFNTSLPARLRRFLDF